MKTLKKISLLVILIFLYVFVLSRNNIPETIAVEGQEIKISDMQVIPVGEIVGIKLYTSGVLVVGTSIIQSDEGTKYKPFENAGAYYRFYRSQFARLGRGYKKAYDGDRQYDDRYWHGSRRARGCRIRNYR